MTLPSPPMAGCVNSHTDIAKEKQLKVFVKQMLVHQTFEAVYQERRWNQTVNAYRDLVVIPKDGNEQFLKDLEVVRSRLIEFYKGSKWIGLTPPTLIGAPAGGFCLWLNLENTAFGKHKFRVRRVKFFDNEICLEIKSTSEIDNLSTSTDSDVTANGSRETEQSTSEPFDVQLKEISASVLALLTRENAIEAARFLSILIATLITVFTKIVYNSGDFTLKLMDRLIRLVQVMMPLLLSIVDLFKKTIGGFLILLSMMWNSYWHSGGPAPPPGFRPRALDFGNDRKRYQPQPRHGYQYQRY
ncbi:uncharacterized protein LOC111051092 [Nilaparvata lugens]|uniref:uncharacterized protein LOC111051092 n=1 Tax=Nilaparvata lugens TaxID=108931 RepID=UPI00193E3E82|nr:uncharacterized protein LOC111051092 [Nilaparvata lugens]